MNVRHKNKCIFISFMSTNPCSPLSLLVKGTCTVYSLLGPNNIYDQCHSNHCQTWPTMNQHSFHPTCFNFLPHDLHLVVLLFLCDLLIYAFLFHRFYKSPHHRCYRQTPVQLQLFKFETSCYSIPDMSSHLRVQKPLIYSNVHFVAFTPLLFLLAFKFFFI